MNRNLRSRLAVIGRPILGPIRQQIFAWVDYRISATKNRPDVALQTWDQSDKSVEAPVTFGEVVPKLLNAISASNAWAREGKRQQDAIMARLQALETTLSDHQAGRPVDSPESLVRYRAEHVAEGTILHLSSVGPGVAGELSRLPFQTASLHEVRIEQLLEFLPAETVARTVLPLLRRLLKPGGHIVVSVANAGTAVSAAAAGQRGLEALEKALRLDARPLRCLYDQHRLSMVLSEAGFTILRIGPANCNPDLLVVEASQPASRAVAD